MSKLFPLLAVGVLAACTSVATFEESRTLLRAHLDTCTSQFGYDRSNVDSLGPYEFGKNEKAWRSCAYDGIERHMIPHTLIPEDYRHIIAEDKAMTARVGNRSLTREARKARLEKLISLIEKKEQKQAALNLQADLRRADDILAIQNQQIRNRMIILRGIQ